MEAKLVKSHQFKLKTSQKSELEANMMLKVTQKKTQEPLFSELSDRGDMKTLFKILVSYKYYKNLKI